jgi:hypothetical protein
MSVQAELRAQKAITRAFILAQPSSIALQPVIVAKTASGGTTREHAAPREAQILRLIDQSTISGNSPGANRAEDGSQTKATHQLLGEYDATMAVGDWWESGGLRYEIVELLPFNGYERRAKVTQYGN